ncbi:Hsp20/alpha crystallin family protein [Streptomyces sp. NPDC003996]
MTLPVHHRPGQLMERALPSLGWDEPIAAEFDDLFEQMSRFPEQAAGVAPSVRAFSPLANLQESGDTYVVEAELPGIKREDIDVEVSERELCITGEYKERERKGVLRSPNGCVASNRAGVSGAVRRRSG